MTTQTQQPFVVVNVAGTIPVITCANVLTTELVSSERTSRLTDRPLGKVPAPTPASTTLLSTANEVGGIREFFGYAPSSLASSTIPVLAGDLGAPFPLNSQPGQPLATSVLDQQLLVVPAGSVLEIWMSDAGQPLSGVATYSFDFYAVPTSIPLAGIVSQPNVTPASLLTPAPPAKLLARLTQNNNVLADAGIVFEQATLPGGGGATEPSAYVPIHIPLPIVTDAAATGPTTVGTVDGLVVPGPEAFYVLATIGQVALTTLTSGDLLLRIKVLTKES